MSREARGVGNHGRRVLMLLVGAAVAVVALVALASFAEHRAYAGKVLPGVHLDGAPVAGKKADAAHDEIARLATELERQPIRAHAGGRTFVVDPSLIGYHIDVDATVKGVRDAGRDSNPIAMVTDTVLRRFRSDDVPLVVTYDESRFQGLLDGWSTTLGKGLVEGGLRFEGTRVIAISPHAGTGLLRDEAERLMRRELASGTRTDTDLPTGVVQPRVDQAAVDAAAVRARALLVGNRTIVAGLKPVTITPPQLAATLGTKIDGHSLDLAIDNAKLAVLVGPAIASVSQPAVDATFAVSSTNAVSVVPSRDGHELDLDALGSMILRGDMQIVAPFRNSHPAHDTAWAQKLGITEQVGTFTTHHPSGQPRVHNIHVAANVLNNTVVEPGKIFSLNDKLGMRTPDKGYVKAPILVDEGFGEDYGGGISQLTTTLYNAVFFGGYVDVEHVPHQFYISRYPMGREATINFPSIDLKFRDDTSHGVLIRTSYSDTAITVTLYGNNEGREVREENRKLLQTVPITDRRVPCSVVKPAEDMNNVCAHLAPGEESTVQTGETGYDVEFDRVIDQPGKPEYRHHYQVHYPMLSNRILIGSGPPPAATTTTLPGTPPTTAAPKKPPATTTKTTVRHT